ncbi:unnamed protein product [Arabis nemorensis]|uniref:Uncharacterized protein n=1 Tax=Arabis nemorensis TaxID=586526 RepID=A0A565C9A3_9BRAS|nr:unnamed protein product [Arabis nemorensis]
MKDRLDSPLLLAAYLLNPFYLYKDSTILYDLEISEGFLNCIETFYHGDTAKQNKVVNDEIHLYRSRYGPFGRSLALQGCEHNDEKFDPDVILDDGNEDTIEEWIVEQHQEEQTSDVSIASATVRRELYDDDFQSEEEDEVVVNMEFEPDVFHDTTLV